MGKLTSEFKYFELPFLEFNPVQEQCLEYFDKDCNLIVSASTASGKSVVAEMLIAYELSKQNTHIVYTSPLKAISNQMYDDWSKIKLFKFHMAHMNKSVENRLLLTTVEGFDVQVRKQAKFIDNISCVIFDEAHLLADNSRGANAEALIMRLTEINSKCRIVFLSGTLNNVVQIAKWIKSLNNKKTNFIKSDWRPTTLTKKVLRSNSKEEINKLITSIITKNLYEKILIFVHSKKQGREMKTTLNSNDIYCEFYSADINNSKGKKILNDFKNSNLDVLITTSALSMGINL